MTRPSALVRPFLGILGVIALWSLPFLALAVDSYPPIICSQLFGCGKPPEDVLMTSTLPTVGSIMIQLAGGGAVIAVVIGGVQMAVSGGDSSKITSARKAIMYAMGGLALAVTAGSIVAFVSTENYGQQDPDLLFGSGGLLASAVRIILVLFNVAFAVVAVIAGIRMVVAGGNAEEFKNAGNQIKWAVIGAIIVNIARALVQALLALNL